MQGHFGEDDSFTTPEPRGRSPSGSRPSPASRRSCYFYPAGHAFFNDENLLGTYDKEQADLAWQRTLAFLRAHVR